MAIEKVKLSDNNVKYTKTINANFSELDLNKVDKVEGKGLSKNDFTDYYKQAVDNMVAISGQPNVIETVKVNGVALTPDEEKAVDITIPAQAEYTMTEAEVEEGYAKSYQLTKDGVAIGAKINIPKDLVVSAGSVKVVEAADQPYEGAKVGDKYVDLELNDATKNHIFIPVQDLVDVYTSGKGVEVTAENKINAVVDAANANGLKVTDNGIALDAATTEANGAMSKEQVAKLEAIEAKAQVNIIEKVKVNGEELTPDGDKAVDVTVPTAIIKGVKVGETTIEADTTEDVVELKAGSNIKIAADADTKAVTIEAVVPASSLMQIKAFSSTDAEWGEIDEDGCYTLTIANSGKPLAVKKIAEKGGYESCMANLRHDGTNFYITSDEKFDGQVYYFM